MTTYVTHRAEGRTVDLGVISMRLITPATETGGAYSVAEFSGAEGRWTVPHVHRDAEESFFVTEGSFVFELGDTEVRAEKGSFVRVPKDTRHVITAGAGGGALLTVWAPGGLEQMFLAMGELPPESITDPEVRRRISRDYDSVPV